MRYRAHTYIGNNVWEHDPIHGRPVKPWTTSNLLTWLKNNEKAAINREKDTIRDAKQQIKYLKEDIVKSRNRIQATKLHFQNEKNKVCKIIRGK